MERQIGFEQDRPECLLRCEWVWQKDRRLSVCQRDTRWGSDRQQKEDEADAVRIPVELVGKGRWQDRFNALTYISI